MAEQVDSEKVIFDLQRASKCLYLELPESIADDVSKKVAAVVEVIRTQAEEIERLKARGVTEWELRGALSHAFGLYGGLIVNLLRAKGLLIEDAPAVKPERIYGVDVPPADQIPEYEVKPAEADSLKVWPKLPDRSAWIIVCSNTKIRGYVWDELARIRAALGVKESG